MQKISFILFLCLVLAACKLPIQKQFIGEWQVIACDADMPELSPALIDSGCKEALSTSYNFAEEGTLFMNADYYPDGLNGTWEYKEQAGNIIIKYPAEETGGLEIYVIELIQKDKMVWRQDFNQLGTITLTLERK